MPVCYALRFAMKRSRAERRGWNAAMEAVQAELAAILKRYRLTPKQRQALEAARVCCGTLRPRLYLPSKATNRDLARKYQVSLRTVTNWKRDGCPFQRGQWAVLRWLGHRRYAPAGTSAKFKRQLSVHRLGAILDEVHAGIADLRQLKRLCRIHGVEPSEWLRRFRSAPL